MRFLVTALVVLMSGAASSASAGIFTVEEGTQFYAKPSTSEDALIDLPEVRVQVPPLQDAQGFAVSPSSTRLLIKETLTCQPARGLAVSPQTA